MNRHKVYKNSKKNTDTKKKDKDYSLLLIQVCVLFFMSYFGITLYKQQTEINLLSGIKNDAIYEYQEKQKELKELEKELKNVDSNEFIEKQAREKLKMVKPNETVYVDTNKKNNIN